MLSFLRPFPLCPPSRSLLLCSFFCRSSSAPDMARYREAFSQRMAMAGIKPHHRIALGVSGGPDSMALCVLAAGWKSDRLGVKSDTAAPGYIDGLLGIVVDHRLRPESAEEANMVRERVTRMGIKCEIECCEWTDGRPKLGHLQEAAREIRYQIFQGVCVRQHIGVLLIAHHSDDQAELFILRLSRNSGVFGLAGMAFVSQLFPKHESHCQENSGSQGILLVRPMLEFSKDDMYKICQGGHQEWVEDPTNQSALFARNRIRTSLKNLSSCVSRAELQRLITACRLTRSSIESICHKLIKHSVTIMDHGYAIIDLEKLEPSKVEDICLSKFLAMILQFISQRHRPVRGSVSQLLLNYIRDLPCKTSLTAAGCYLCAAPRSKGMKILVCSAFHLPYSLTMSLSSNYCDEQLSLVREMEQSIMDAKTYSDQLVPETSSVHFLHAKSSEAILNEAKKLKLISESTFTSIRLLQMEENKTFSSKTEVEPDHEQRHENKISNDSKTPFYPGQSCHFMSRFLMTWKNCRNDAGDESSSSSNDFDQESEDNQENSCQWCMIRERQIAIRNMIDADWLYLAKLSKCPVQEYSHGHADASVSKLEQSSVTRNRCTNYMQLSAYKALQALKSIPASARRALPVLVNSHDLVVSIPSIGFRCCPSLSVVCDFRPRVPLGGGFSSFV